jgi:molecular chaperone GrpE
VSDGPEATGSERPADAATESGVTDEVTSDPGAAEAQEVPAEDSLGGTAASSGPDAEGRDNEGHHNEGHHSDGHHSEDDASGNDESDSVDRGTADHGGDRGADDADVNTEAINDPAETPSATAAEAMAATGGSTRSASGVHPDTRLARERLEDLQRLQAEYVNYKRRVDRDRALVQERAIADVLDSLLPVLDDIHAAREHGDLTEGPFAAIADKLESSLGKFGLERFGAPGEAFDPTVHEALLHTEWDEAVTPTDPSATTVVQVLQPGYRTGQQVIRPARVSVADPG